MGKISRPFTCRTKDILTQLGPVGGKSYKYTKNWFMIFLRNRCFRPKNEIKKYLKDLAYALSLIFGAKQTGLVTESNVAYQENVQT